MKFRVIGTLKFVNQHDFVSDQYTISSTVVISIVFSHELFINEIYNGVIYLTQSVLIYAYSYIFSDRQSSFSETNFGEYHPIRGTLLPNPWQLRLTVKRTRNIKFNPS